MDRRVWGPVRVEGTPGGSAFVATDIETLEAIVAKTEGAAVLWVAPLSVVLDASVTRREAVGVVALVGVPSDGDLAALFGTEDGGPTVGDVKVAVVAALTDAMGVSVPHGDVRIIRDGDKNALRHDAPASAAISGGGRVTRANVSLKLNASRAAVDVRKDDRYAYLGLHERDEGLRRVAERLEAMIEVQNQKIEAQNAKIGAQNAKIGNLEDTVQVLTGMSVGMSERRLIELCVAWAQQVAWVRMSDHAQRTACWGSVYRRSNNRVRRALEEEGAWDARAVRATMSSGVEVRIAPSPEHPADWDTFEEVANTTAPGWMDVFAGDGRLAAVLRIATRKRTSARRVARGARADDYAHTYEGLSESIAYGYPPDEILRLFSLPILAVPKYADCRAAAGYVADTAANRVVELDRRFKTAEEAAADTSFEPSLDY